MTWPNKPSPKPLLRMSLTNVERARKEELREVLCKYGLQADLEVVWDMGLRDVEDIPWMTFDDPWMTDGEMRDKRLRGTAAQYIAMQEGEFAVEEPEVENWYRH